MIPGRSATGKAPGDDFGVQDFHIIKAGVTREQIDQVLACRRKTSPRNPPVTYDWSCQPALRGLLEQVGVAAALTAYHSERNGGKLTLIDGHLRKQDYDLDWPTLILDVTDEEADLLLASHDPLVALAEYDRAKLDGLLQNVRARSPALLGMLKNLAAKTAAGAGRQKKEDGVSLPPERYEIVVECSDETHQREVFDCLTGEDTRSAECSRFSRVADRIDVPRRAGQGDVRHPPQGRYPPRMDRGHPGSSGPNGRSGLSSARAGRVRRPSAGGCSPMPTSTRDTPGRRRRPSWTASPLSWTGGRSRKPCRRSVSPARRIGSSVMPISATDKDSAASWPA